MGDDLTPRFIDDDTFCKKGKEYWAKISPTVDGMLGGFSHISNVDIQASKKFITPFLFGKKARTGHSHALDCGAGIGRVTKHLLSHIFTKVDMLEQNQKFLEVAREYLGERIDKVDCFLNAGLQEFIPVSKKYDVIWVQWVISHIPDEGVVTFFSNCKKGLKDNGLLIIKENISNSGETNRDDADFSITRPGRELRGMIRKAGFVITKEMKQPKFPVELYEVRLFACRLPDKN